MKHAAALTLSLSLLLLLPFCDTATEATIASDWATHESQTAAGCRNLTVVVDSRPRYFAFCVPGTTAATAAAAAMRSAAALCGRAGVVGHEGVPQCAALARELERIAAAEAAAAAPPPSSDDDDDDNDGGGGGAEDPGGVRARFASPRRGVLDYFSPRARIFVEVDLHTPPPPMAPPPPRGCVVLDFAPTPTWCGALPPNESLYFLEVTAVAAARAARLANAPPGETSCSPPSLFFFELKLVADVR
jgi:hypothetical protein